MRRIFKNRKQILEGIKNNIFKKEHIEEIAKKRLEICFACPFLDKTGKKCDVYGTQPCCGQCGCSLKLKTRALASGCPEYKWEPLMDRDLEKKLRKKL